MVEQTNEPDEENEIDLDGSARPEQSKASPTWTGLFTLPALCFPSLITMCTVEPGGFADRLWHRACQTGSAPIRPIYRFPRGMPAGLFERATVRLNWPEESKFHYMEHWKTGVQMRHTTKQLLVRFTVHQPDDADPFLRFEFRGLIREREEPSIENEVNPDPAEIPNTSGSLEQTELRKSHKKVKPKWHGWPVPEEVLWDWILPLLKALDVLLLAYEAKRCKEADECGAINSPEVISIGEALD
ncbi:unnamed protein product [Echinostoma caproni]|uniref:Reelin domain-containing protein n=1 Tax=Echinostoma caproni TaxID=27848 RepID=A0A183AL10_9TREM|nr:unnamed protein product [Echinostoma caproni]